jgi:pyridinium-3,5-bisthiocarboxylic acid mononucleotide nickel chelatase
MDCQRVWRGSGSIAAMHVVVHSVYGHQPVPVPIRSMRDEVTTAAEDDAPPSSHHVHDHQHDHGHPHIHTRHNLSQTTIQDEEPIDDEISRSCGATYDHSHSHTHGTVTNGIDHHVRNLPQIRQMLLDASEEHIPQWVRENAIAAFTELAMAEATVHGANSMDDVHFHEVGAVDSIVDTVGTLLALHYLGVTSVSCSRLPLGEGMVTTEHGVLPVPAPATLLLMVGMPTTPGPPGRTGELVTPTAASMLRVLCKNPTDGRSPCMTLRKVGIGAGSKDFKGHPNIVRLLLGECV